MSVKRFALALFVASLALHACQFHAHAQKLQARQLAPQKLSAQQDSSAAKLSVLPKSSAAKKSYVADELLVQFADEKTMQAARTLHAAIGATVVREFAA